MNHTYFVTTQTWGRRQFLQSDRMAALFVATLQEYRSQGKFSLHAYVVMKDHIHVLLSSELPIENVMQLIKGGFSFRAGKQFGMEGRIWNHRFDARKIQTFEGFETARAYIHRNPIKAGFVKEASEYLYSSAVLGSHVDEVPQWLAVAHAAVK